MYVQFMSCVYGESNLNLKCVIKNGLHRWHAKSSKIETKHPETCNTTHNLEVKFYSKALLSDSLSTGGSSRPLSLEKSFSSNDFAITHSDYSNHTNRVMKIVLCKTVFILSFEIRIFCSSFFACKVKIDDVIKQIFFVVSFCVIC